MDRVGQENYLQFTLNIQYYTTTRNIVFYSDTQLVRLYILW